MKPRQSTQDKVKGTARIAKGKAKQAVGAITGNRRMQSEGAVDELAGRAQKKGGEVERVFEKD